MLTFSNGILLILILAAFTLFICYTTVLIWRIYRTLDNYFGFSKFSRDLDKVITLMMNNNNGYEDSANLTVQISRKIFTSFDENVLKNEITIALDRLVRKNKLTLVSVGVYKLTEKTNEV